MQAVYAAIPVYIQVRVSFAADGPLPALSSHAYFIICSAVFNNVALAVCHDTQTTRLVISIYLHKHTHAI